MCNESEAMSTEDENAQADVEHRSPTPRSEGDDEAITGSNIDGDSKPLINRASLGTPNTALVSTPPVSMPDPLPSSNIIFLKRESYVPPVKTVLVAFDTTPQRRTSVLSLYKTCTVIYVTKLGWSFGRWPPRIHRRRRRTRIITTTIVLKRWKERRKRRRSGHSLNQFLD